jgi:RNA polymerase sigma-70 factor (ECF subfamily)
MTMPTADDTDQAHTLVRDLYQRNGPAMLAFATRLLGDAHIAEDVVQEAMMRAWRQAESLARHPLTVRSWLFRVTHNLVVDRFRHVKCRPTEVFVAVEGPTEPDRTDQVLDSVILTRALRQLTPAHRRILEEVYLNGRTAAEAAGRLGIPVGTAKSRLHHARNGFREIVEATGIAA